MSPAKHHHLAQRCLEGGQGCCVQAVWSSTPDHSSQCWCWAQRGSHICSISVAEPQLALLLRQLPPSGEVSAAERKHRVYVRICMMNEFDSCRVIWGIAAGSVVEETAAGSTGGKTTSVTKWEQEGNQAGLPVSLLI